MKPGHFSVKTCRSIRWRHLPPGICDSASDVLARVGDKWSLQIVYALSNGSMRFSELKRSLDSISQKILTTTLRGSERDGYVKRNVTPRIPPRVDYELTALGRDALVPVTALAMWALSRRGDVEAARASFVRLARRSS